MTRLLFIALALLVAVAAAAAAAAGKAERKKEIRQLRQELRHENLLARMDLRALGPAPAAGVLTELEDGSTYLHADPGLLFEKLGPVRVYKLVMRDGHRLVVRLIPPSDIRPRLGHAAGFDPPAWEQQGMSAGPERGRGLSIDVDLNDFESVRAALSTLVFLPGQAPTEEEIADCVARYPDHDERVSAMRCGAAK